jgi:hypothetical protein
MVSHPSRLKKQRAKSCFLAIHPDDGAFLKPQETGDKKLLLNSWC